MPSKAEPIGELGAGRLGNFCPYYSGSALRVRIAYGGVLRSDVSVLSGTLNV